MQTPPQIRPCAPQRRSPAREKSGFLLGFACFALLLLSFLQLACWGRTFDASKHPDLVLITIDTVRADHLELYGYERVTAPNLTQLGRSGIVFEHAVAQAPWTLPSMASIHTGLPPSGHGAIDNASPIGDAHATLAEILRANGYRTQAVVSHVFIGHKFGFDRGFDAFDESLLQGHEGSSSRALTETALALFSVPSDAPTFLWVHYFDPHYSYLRHPEFNFASGPRGRFGDAIHFATPEGTELYDVSQVEKRYMSDVFDEEIAHTDRWIGALIEGVLASDRDRAAVFVVTADHGEAFLERGRLAHGKDLYDELIHVPLIIGGDIDPALSGLTVGHPVETASIATTLLRLAKVEQHPIAGVDLIASALDQSIPSQVFSEGSYARGRDQRKVCIERGRWKLIQHLDTDRFELYDRTTDPGEQHNLIDDPGSAFMRDTLTAAIAPRTRKVRAQSRIAKGSAKGGAKEARLSEAEREKLRALGYLELERREERDSAD